jgi:glucose-1-phosphate cytidylyltransferase
VKTILLAGGLGTRLAEETAEKPKPMVNILEKPLLWHLMNLYASQNYSDFLVAGGYKVDVIHNWVDQRSHSPEIDWNIEVIDTGLNTQTGGRVKQIMKQFPNESFMATYGDGLANIRLDELIKFHKSHGKIATLTSVRPPARFGYLRMEGDAVVHFGEKNQSDVGSINGGFFVFEPEIVDFISGDSEPLEEGALPRLAQLGELYAFRHDGFWQPMDTLREKIDLERYASQTPPPWLEK